MRLHNGVVLIDVTDNNCDVLYTGVHACPLQWQPGMMSAQEMGCMVWRSLSCPWVGVKLLNMSVWSVPCLWVCVCAQVRLGEKEALDGLMAFFEGRAADLRALQYYQVTTQAEGGWAGGVWVHTSCVSSRRCKQSGQAGLCLACGCFVANT